MSEPSRQRYIPALGFHWLTPYYDAVVGTTTRERTFKKALIEQASLEPGHRVLDLACGTGTLAVWAKQSRPEADITGVDGDPAILSLAARKAERASVAVRFDKALSHDLPYPEAHFDRVVSSLFFHHLSWEDKRRTASELFRVLRPGAELHVADWGRPANLLMRGLFLFVQLLDGFGNTQDNVRGRLVPLFEEAGFSPVSQRSTFSTIYGTMALYHAVKPSQGAVAADTSPQGRAPSTAARVVAAALVLLSGVAGAHDTWLMPGAWAAATSKGATVELTSAGSFPKPELAVSPDRLVQIKVRSGGKTQDITDIKEGKSTLEALLPAAPPGVATIWMESKPRSIELTPDQVTHYLEEIGAAETIGTEWLKQPEPRKWRESYRKLAKTYVLLGPTTDQSWSVPVGLSLELIPESDPTSLRVGDRLAVRVLHNGAPLAGVAVYSQAAGEKPSPGMSDSQGRVTISLGKAGAWLVRGTLIMRSTAPNETWQTEMATLTIGVGPRKSSK